MKKTIFYILLVCLACLSCFACEKSPQTAEVTPTPLPTSPALAKPTYNVQVGDVIGLVRFTGRIMPVIQEDVLFKINGRVLNVYVKEGDSVTQGQILADLEGVDDLERRLALLQINQQRVQIQAEIAQYNLDLFKINTPTWSRGYEEQLAIAERQVALAQLSVQEASLGSQELEITISNNRLTSPLDGVITMLRLVSGREVQGYNSVGTISDLSSLEVGAAINSDIEENVEMGMPATIEPVSGLTPPVPGVVRYLPLQGNEDYTNPNGFRVAFVNPSDLSQYEMGDLVQVSVVIIEHKNVLWLPPQAVRIFEGRRFVVVQEGDIQRRVDVRIGIVSEDRVEILEGLTEGQVVVSP
jgi:macrolide-specific efflux system membrane fusion protein